MGLEQLAAGQCSHTGLLSMVRFRYQFCLAKLENSPRLLAELQVWQVESFTAQMCCQYTISCPSLASGWMDDSTSQRRSLLIQRVELAQ
jgi:hypothetical protein